MNDSRRGKSQNNRADAPEDLKALIKLRMVSESAVYPRRGTFGVKAWAWWACIKPDTFVAWVNKWNIPYRMPGNEWVVDAEDFHQCVPISEIR